MIKSTLRHGRESNYGGARALSIPMIMFLSRSMSLDSVNLVGHFATDTNEAWSPGTKGEARLHSPFILDSLYYGNASFTIIIQPKSINSIAIHLPGTHWATPQVARLKSQVGPHNLATKR